MRRQGYTLLHDLQDLGKAKPNAKGNLDHVVVSSAGVFLLDSKLLGGVASIRDDTVRVQRRDDDEDSYDMWWLAKSVRARARRLCEDIEQDTGVQSIPAVVVFWNDFPARLVERGDLVFVHGARLVPWLEDQPQTLDARRVGAVVACIKRKRPSATGSQLPG